jgi:hypothetical protein
MIGAPCPHLSTKHLEDAGPARAGDLRPAHQPAQCPAPGGWSTRMVFPPADPPLSAPWLTRPRASNEFLSRGRVSSASDGSAAITVGTLVGTLLGRASEQQATLEDRA